MRDVDARVFAVPWRHAVIVGIVDGAERFGGDKADDACEGVVNGF